MRKGEDEEDEDEDIDLEIEIENMKDYNLSAQSVLLARLRHYPTTREEDLQLYNNYINSKSTVVKKQSTVNNQSTKQNPKKSKKPLKKRKAESSTPPSKNPLPIPFNQNQFNGLIVRLSEKTILHQLLEDFDKIT